MALQGPSDLQKKVPRWALVGPGMALWPLRGRPEPGVSKRPFLIHLVLGSLWSLGGGGGQGGPWGALGACWGAPWGSRGVPGRSLGDPWGVLGGDKNSAKHHEIYVFREKLGNLEKKVTLENQFFFKLSFLLVYFISVRGIYQKAVAFF